MTTIRTYVKLAVSRDELERLDDNTIELSLPVQAIGNELADMLKDLGLKESAVHEVYETVNELSLMQAMRERIVIG